MALIYDLSFDDGAEMMPLEPLPVVNYATEFGNLEKEYIRWLQRDLVVFSWRRI